MHPGYVYDLAVSKTLKSEAGQSILNPKLYYNCNRLLDGSEAPLQIPETRVVTPIDPAKLKLSPGDGLVFQAEDANVHGPGILNSNAGFTGKGYADYRAASDESLIWAIDLEEGGEYDLKIRYAVAGGGRPLQLLVNANGQPKDGEVLRFQDTGSWTTWGIQTARVVLTEGRNVIQLRSFGKSGPNVDEIALRAVR